MTEAKTSSKMDGGGVALWRRVADDLRLDINGGRYIDGGKLPPEAELAARFAVNRHTVRRALVVLQDEGIVRTEQGRGSFVHRSARLSYPIGRRTRFSDGFGDQAREIHGELLSDRIETAPLPVSRALGLSEGTRVVRLETVHYADGKALSRATTWLAARRFDAMPAAYRASGSMTASLKSVGVPDYVRTQTRVSARYADAEEAQTLGLAPGAVLLVSTAENAEPDGTPTHFSVTRFAADRVELVISGQDAI